MVLGTLEENPLMSDTPTKTTRQTRTARKAATATPSAKPGNGAGAPLNVFGNIDPGVNESILQMRNQTGQILNEIGRIEVRKAQLIRQLNQMEAQTQALLKSEAQNLGIPDGTPWQLTPDGVALGLPKGE